jgi:hypothetical protein
VPLRSVALILVLMFCFAFDIASEFQKIVVGMASQQAGFFGQQALRERTNWPFAAINSKYQASALHSSPYVTVPARTRGRCGGID